MVAVEVLFLRVPRVRRAVHLVFVAVLSGTFALQILDDLLGAPAGVVIVLAAASRCGLRHRLRPHSGPARAALGALPGRAPLPRPVPLLLAGVRFGAAGRGRRGRPGRGRERGTGGDGDLRRVLERVAGGCEGPNRRLPLPEPGSAGRRGHLVPERHHGGRPHPVGRAGPAHRAGPARERSSHRSGPPAEPVLAPRRPLPVQRGGADHRRVPPAPVRRGGEALGARSPALAGVGPQRCVAAPDPAGGSRRRSPRGRSDVRDFRGGGRDKPAGVDISAARDIDPPRSTAGSPHSGSSTSTCGPVAAGRRSTSCT